MGTWRAFFKGGKAWSLGGLLRIMGLTESIMSIIWLSGFVGDLLYI
jgi:hypothetical protein